MEEMEDSKEICVDTDILIDFMKKRDPGSRAYERWRNKSAVGTSSITAFELLIGARQPNLSTRRYDEAKSLIERQQFILPFDLESAEMASEVGAELRQKGEGIEIRDLFIASICLAKKIPLLTRNRSHYERVSKLKLLEV